MSLTIRSMNPPASAWDTSFEINRRAHTNPTFRTSYMKHLQPLFVTGALLLGVCIAPSSASAASRAWSGAGADTFWSTAGNWSPSGIPGVSDNVTFTNVGGAANPIALGGAVNNLVDAG